MACAALFLAAPACVPFDGLVAEGWWYARQHEYLSYAGEELAPGSLLNILANLELERRDPRHVVPAGAVPTTRGTPSSTSSSRSATPATST